MTALVMLLTPLGASASPPQGDGLLSVKQIPLPTLPQQAIAGRSRAVAINYGQLIKGKISVKLPGDISFEAVRDEVIDLGGGRGAWTGHVEGDSSSMVVIAVSGGSFAGTFAFNGMLFRLEPRAGGGHVLSEVRPNVPFAELEPLLVGDDAGLATDSSPGNQNVVQGGSEPAAGGVGSVIDVLVAYTPAVAALYGGPAGADALAIQAVVEANKAYSYSNMTTRLNLVHTVLTDYTESDSMSTDIGRLSGTGDGYMDELHLLRDAHGADVVSLIENNVQYCGLGYRMKTVSTNFAPYAFSIVHHGCATSYFSFAHEIGHNQGAHHDFVNATGLVVYPYAYGYQDPGNTFRTVMAYDCPGGCPRWPVFSHGDNPLSGQATGFPGSSENALVIDQTAPTVAAFRQTLTQIPPGAITDLSAAGITTSAISLSWTDILDDEDNYYVERSGDGVSFTQVATLPADSSSYTDTGLAQDVLYRYRVRASNSSGYSPYGNVASAATAYGVPGC